MAINKTLDIDISSQSAFIKIHIPQGDNIDRKYYINFLDGSNEFIIPSTAIVRFQMTKFNGTVIYNNCPVVNNQVEFDITPAISAESGRHPAQFKITDSFTGGELKSFKLHLLIEENVDIESVVVNTSEFTALQDMELRLGDADALLEAAIDNAGNAAENANSKATLAQIAATNANDKATYAQTKGDYANTKALEAENSATNANEKANYAQTKGDFAIEAGNRTNEISNSVEAAEALRPKYIYLTRSEYDALPLSDKEDRNKIYEITDDDGQIPNELLNLINKCQDATKAAWNASVGALPDIITPGTYNKVNVDSKGRVESASLESKISELGITDVYTKNDIDTKLGNINSEKLDIGNEYRPNLFDNGNLSIWSNGNSFTNPNGYATADRWVLNFTGTVEKNDIGMKITTSSAIDWGVIGYQQFERFNGIQLAGKQVTISARLRGNVTSFGLQFSTLTQWISSPTPYNISVTDWIVPKLTFTMPTDITDATGLGMLRCYFLLAASSGQWIEIDYIKLEINNHATPFIPKSYKEELLNCSDNVGYAPNVLINGDFQVWQRGETFDRTSITGRFYAADRWCVFRDLYAAGANVVRDGENFKFTCLNDAKNTAVTQSIETNNSRKLRGKKVTLSARLKTNNAVNLSYLALYCSTGSDYIPGQSPDIVIFRNWVNLSSEFTVFEATGVIPNDAQSIYVEIGASAGAVITMEYVKLEVNDHATPFIPKSYAEELALCRRYYEKIKEATFVKILDSVNLYAPTFRFAVEKRTVPTIKYSSNGVVNQIVNGTGITLSQNITVSNPRTYTLGSAALSAAVSDNAFTVVDVEVDAEI